MVSFTPIRLLIVVGMIILIAPMGLNYLFSTIYAQYGREGCSYISNDKIAIDFYNYLSGWSEGHSTGNYNQAIIGAGNLVQMHKNAKTSFETMSFFAITEDEKQLAKSLISYCDYNIIMWETYRDVWTYFHNQGIYENRSTNYQQRQELERITSKFNAIDESVVVQRKDILALLDRMPKYQDDFDIFYSSGGISSYSSNRGILYSLPDFFPILFIVLSVIIIPSAIAYVPVRKKKNKIEKISSSLLIGFGLLITLFITLMRMDLDPYSNINFDFITFDLCIILGGLCFTTYGLYLTDFTTKVKNKYLRGSLSKPKNFRLFYGIGLFFLGLALFFLLTRPFVFTLVLSMLFFILYSYANDKVTYLYFSVINLILAIIYFVIWRNVAFLAYFFIAIMAILLIRNNFKSNNSNLSFNLKKLEINPNRKESSIDFLKAFDKLSDKEILAFMYLKNNPNTSVDKLNEQFGEEIIKTLLQKGHFIEEI